MQVVGCRFEVQVQVWGPGYPRDKDSGQRIGCIHNLQGQLVSIIRRVWARFRGFAQTQAQGAVEIALLYYDTNITIDGCTQHVFRKDPSR